MSEQVIVNTSSAENLVLLDIHALQGMGVPRAIAYQLLNRADMPVISFGRRKFMVRDKFMQRLDEISNGAMVAG